MDSDQALNKDDQLQKNMLKNKTHQSSDEDEDEDEGTMDYMKRPDFVALDAQESVFDRGSLNKQLGINTKPSIFSSTWK